MEEETQAAIEVLPPYQKKPWEPDAGPTTLFRLRLMTPEQIAAAGLEKYATHLTNDTHR